MSNSREIDTRNLYSLFNIFSYRALKITELMNELTTHLFDDEHGINDKAYSTLLSLAYNVDENIAKDIQDKVKQTNGRYKIQKSES